ncbi:polysaccharide deacetylase family protein [Streptomyces sp. PSKA54]|uniref:Polysaccharide deacetylase family protein n=1 Tax=Streptomyces himalayensis subsp. aureolus TaxID=2758039 RepID=A0A7W2D0U7_9ACTN|nr:polysaccharide deacetylase family protein [Streptomyces himalayensis]MBA4862707.1 polysaccharide deacetylase family protein [Streptomyces himalayensis subsp. aureolus]
MGRVTTADRRSALRTGAGLAVAGTLTAGCSTSGPARPAGPRPGEPSARPAPAEPSADLPGPRRFPGLPAQISHSPRGRPEVALTFHGQGDPATAVALLEAAERAGARMTVLAVGTWLDEHPELARRVLDGGHEIGNHTLNHRAINAMSESEAAAEINGCAGRLHRLTGSIGSFFRPSQAKEASPLVERLARNAGYPHVLSYDVDSLDFTSPGPEAVVRTVGGQVRPGSVVSLHFGYADTVAALPALLDLLDRRGLRAVTTTELLT